MLILNDKSLAFLKINNINEIIKTVYEEDQDLSFKCTYFLQKLRNIVYYDYGNFVFYRKTPDDTFELEDFYQLGWKPEIQKQYLTYDYKEDDVFPIFYTKTPIVIKSTEVFPDSRKVKDYYKRFMEPAGFVFSLECNIIFPEGINCYGVCSLFRDSTRKDFTQEEKSIFELFQPHLSNSLKRYFLNSQHNLPLSEACGFLASGVILIDNNYKIIFKDKDFDNILRRHGEPDDLNIQNAVIQYCRQISQETGREIKKFWYHNLEKYPLYLEIVVLSQKTLNQEHVFVCKLYDIAEMMKGRLTEVCDKYDISPREYEIINMLIKGYKIEEIAQKLYVSNATIKKHLSSIYSKFKIEGQRQLLSVLSI